MSSLDTVYLDNAATTPLRPVAREAVEAVLCDNFGNASGVHSVARAAKTALEEARETVADGLGCRPGEVVFTSGGTESDNLAVKGAAHAARRAGRGETVVTTTIEHKAVLASCDRLESEGFRVRRVGCDTGGVVDLDALSDALDDDTVVVSIMLVNNEVGTVQPLETVADLVAERSPRAVLHTDAVQAVPWVDVEAAAARSQLVSVSAHKFGGPKGVGALVVREGTRLEPLLEGGGQEGDLRSGTHNVAGIVGMAAALRETVAQRPDDTARVGALRDRLAAGLLEAVPRSWSNGDPLRKVAGNCHVGFPGLEVETMLLAFDQDGLCAAAGSACQSGSLDPSYVLLEMGMDRRDALASVRFSLGWSTTPDDVDAALALIPAAVSRLRPARRR
ncbi:MAG: cysteine desulfurase [Acidimicrobiia bacterium]|nr:cysteine desulfurase [Acidimicrobiia bacterium]